MALTVDEQKRIQRIEVALGEHTTAINNLAAKRQLSHVNTIISNELKEIRDAIDSLQAQINAIKQ